MSKEELFLKEKWPEHKGRNEEALKRCEVFKRTYPIDKIMDIPLDKYVISPKEFGRVDTFCYKIKNDLRLLSSMGNAVNDVFGIYLKGGTELTLSATFEKRFSNDFNAAFAFIKGEIVNVLNSVKVGDYEVVKTCLLNSLFVYKLISIYYLDKFIPVCSKGTLDAYCKCLGMESDALPIYKNLSLVECKKNNPKTAEWDNQKFMLYCDWLWRPNKQTNEEIETKNEDPEAYEIIEKKEASDTQKEDELQELRDKEYPQKYTAELNIGVSDWKSMLADPDIFLPPNIALMKRFYVEDNHATTLYELGLQDGVSHSSYIRPVVGLAKRVSEKMTLKPLYRQEGNSKKKGTRVWWRILFWGRRREDGRFEWKLQPNLAKALQQMYPELDADTADDEQEHKFLKGICQAEAVKTPEGFEFKGQSKVKEEPLIVKGRKVYPRDRQTAINALAHAHYACEVDKKHPVFIRRNSDKGYTEPHHLIPMAFQDRFDVSLDVEENIVSLCSNCHNQIHYGKDADKLLKMLYESRKKDLEKVGIKVTFDELIKMYHL